jgi:uncharacterized protein YndB with AHSA1/START domain
MARNETFVDAPPEAVFELLSDPLSYAHWVVGTHEVRTADEHWPRPGSKLGHTVGLPPLRVKDATSVVRARAPAMLELHARARPFPSARVTLHLEPEGEGTRVTLIEDLANPLLNLLAGPLGHAAMRLRNHESLRRLKAIAERRAASDG